MPRSLLPAFVLAFLLSAAATVRAADPAPAIAVCNLEQALQACRFYAGPHDLLRKEKSAIEAQLKDLGDQITKLETVAQALPAGSAKLAQTQEELEVAKLKREMLARRASGDLERRHSALVKETFGWLRARLAEYCRERGIKIVIQSQDGQIGGASTMELNVNLGLQSVLYADPANDITAGFIAWANERFEQQPKPAAAP